MILRPLQALTKAPKVRCGIKSWLVKIVRERDKAIQLAQQWSSMEAQIIGHERRLRSA